MNRNVLRLIGTCLLLLASSAAIAQSARKAETRTIGQELDVWVTKTEEQLVPTAGAMPEEKYGFAPTAGAFDGVRAFAEQTSLWPPPTTYWLLLFWARNRRASLKSKAEILEYLKGPFAYLHRAAAVINEENSAEIGSSIVLVQAWSLTRSSTRSITAAKSWSICV